MAYVGIVLVSHSAELATGLRDLLSQVAGDDVRVEPAGGADDGTLGTSADRIGAAITRADAGAGVLILADLGSAVLTTRAVLDDLPPGPVLADAPFVEGAVAAAVIASTGAGLAEVADAAREARDVPKL
ncbi:dihydroxyacetone kinase phosphoryl donor subunit DhaM [Actinoplanes utahensis]|uniref:phosphoenolpyruvate--glycerone phosphotransferase n=1 Tax=Actinoplanes utahensis TaxID=1869 RepID=A0A0A6X9A1_ACTUT|nr:dihydroxyacetone kinase phosphoryl donor subunit DhaM [Actinoplanes utahensis]KHD76697.1 phosphoenolpyruvate-protein phosphotransferase [Actinoplanes utahensis]GIF33246.1 PTS fructose transporter subunit IIA [Actinoplanes utahensis]